MEQTKALNALEPFLALTKSASSPRAAVDLISRATSASNTFIFTELLLAPQIQALAESPEYASYLELLSIFCYGTYDFYIQRTNLPPLNEAQALKLRQLSLLTLAQDPRNLTYKTLMSVLGLDSARDLENLVISAIYAGLLSGTLDPYNQRVCIASVSPLRDVSPNSVPSMIATLREWSDRCSSTLSGLEKQIASIKADAVRRHKEEREWEANVEKMISEEGNPAFKDAARKLGGGGKKSDNMKRGFVNFGGGDVDDGDMDVDDEDEEEGEKRAASTRSLKKRGLAGLGAGFGRG